MAAEWRRRLGVDEVAAGDNFFELGGNSLLAIQVATALARQLGRSVDPRAMFFDSLRQFAAALDGARSTAP